MKIATIHRRFGTFTLGGGDMWIERAKWTIHGINNASPIHTIKVIIALHYTEMGTFLFAIFYAIYREDQQLFIHIDVIFSIV